MADRSPARRPVNVIGVLLSLVLLGVASIGIGGNPFWLLDAGTRWIAAAVIAVIGLGVLISALPRRGRSGN